MPGRRLGKKGMEEQPVERVKEGRPDLVEEEEEKEPTYLYTRSTSGTILYLSYGAMLMAATIWWFILGWDNYDRLSPKGVAEVALMGTCATLAVILLVVVSMVPKAVGVRTYSILGGCLVSGPFRVSLTYLLGSRSLREFLNLDLPWWVTLWPVLLTFAVICGVIGVGTEGRWLKLRPVSVHIVGEPSVDDAV